ncbi:hypothetical protein L1887_55595 [Cichorium endivia]|nr:hypothetical protein L1887_55595 [Cichorium endivia]
MNEAGALRCIRAEERKEEKLENDGWRKLSMRKREVVSGVQAAREGSWDLQAHPSTLLPSRPASRFGPGGRAQSMRGSQARARAEEREKQPLIQPTLARASLPPHYRTAHPSAEREEQFTRTRPNLSFGRSSPQQLWLDGDRLSHEHGQQEQSQVSRIEILYVEREDDHHELGRERRVDAR